MHMKLRDKLLISYFVLSIVPLLIVGGLAYYTASAALVNQAADQLYGVARKAIEQVDAFLGVCRSNINELASQSNSAMAFLLSDFDQDLTPNLVKFKEYLKERSYLSNVRLINLKGIEILSSLPEFNGKKRNLAKVDWFVNAQTTERGFSTPLYRSADTQKIVKTFATPVFDDKGVKKGLIAFDVDAAAVTAFVDSIAVGKTGYGYIMDTTGMLLAHPSPEKILQENLLNSTSKSLVTIVKAMVKMQKGMGRYSYEGVDKYVFYAPDEQQGWVIAITIPVKEMNASSRMLLQVIVTISLLALMVTVGVSLGVSQSVVRPIQLIVNMLGELAQQGGDLTQRLHIKSNDELGQLAEKFNGFIATLQNMVLQVRTNADKVSSLAEGLSTSAQEINASTQEVSATFQRLNQGVNTQAQRIAETVQVIGTMNTSLQHIAQNTGDGARVAQETATLAKEGKESSAQAVTRTSRIAEVAQQIAEVVGHLGSRSEEIGRIVEVITTIADQTNLLALNAAIEAARAGDAGRGFAVVADEVRKLAENSARAADQIAKLIRTIQNETSQAVTSVTATSVEVQEGTKIIDQVKASLDRIQRAAERSAEQVEQTAEETKKQLGDTQALQNTINQITAVADDSSAAIEQAASSVQEMTASMQEMTASTQELAQKADELTRLVHKFKLQ